LRHWSLAGDPLGRAHRRRHFSDHAEPVEGALPFNVRWAQKLMTMASNAVIVNASHATHLPADLNTVYELATMTAPALEAAIEAGKVTPATTRAEALASYMDAVGARKSKGGRPKKNPAESAEFSPTLPSVAEKLGIAERTARDHLRAAEDYQAAAPELRVKVDAAPATMPATATRR
jgi:hypothetical protein